MPPKNDTKEKIEIPKKWLERLYELAYKVQNGDVSMNYFLGYIESIKNLFDKK